MEELLLSMPPTLTFGDEEAWLTVTASNKPDIWMAFYMCEHGNGIGNFIAEGPTPLQALEELKKTVDLLRLWKKPSSGESVDGMVGTC